MPAELTLALAGDTMLGRSVAEQLERPGARAVFSDGVRRVMAGAQLRLVNLECCISPRGEPTEVIPGKPFFFRAPPRAAEVLAQLGVDIAVLANNHALDYGPQALADTRELLEAAGIRAVGAGPTVAAAREPVVLEAAGTRIAVLAVTDHPPEFAAGPDRPGVAFADLQSGVPEWLTARIRELSADGVDAVLLSVHWGPNMVGRPVGHVRGAAPVLLEAGARLVIGHSAHVFHGFTRRVLYDLGDFVDDYAVHPVLRNDLGLIWRVALDPREPEGPHRTEAVPIALDFCRVRLADREEYAWIADRLTETCAALGTEVSDRGDRLVAQWGAREARPGEGA